MTLPINTKTDIIRQIGNAVPVRLAAALVGAMMAPAQLMQEAAECPPRPHTSRIKTNHARRNAE